MANDPLTKILAYLLSLLFLTQPEQHGRTALHVAAETRQATVVDRLLKAGARFDLRSSDGETALHTAARHLDRTIVARLLSAGADPNTPIIGDGKINARKQEAIFGILCPPLKDS